MKLLFVFGLLIWSVQSSRILGIFPLHGNSHYNLARALLRGLAERGHDVTVINTFGEKEPPKNGTYRDIIIKMNKDIKLSEKETQKKWNMFTREGSNPFVDVIRTTYMAEKFIGKSMNDEGVQNLLNSSEEHFDVVIVDQFLSDAYKAVATHFNAPLIALNPTYPNYWINALVGNPAPPSYIPNILTQYSHPLTFCERLSNSLLHVFSELVFHYILFPKHAEFARKFIPSHPNLYDSLYNVSLVLLNSHPALNDPVPQVPNMVEIGGFHLQPPKKLPKNLKDFFDNSPEGVIYFSMGSNLQGVMFPEKQRQEIMKAFSKLKQRVLWKWEDEELPGKPENVRIIKWAPQQDILAHPNLKLFITHGGFVSSTETAYHGVPVLVIPVFGDQTINGKFAAKRGFGRYLKLQDINEKTFLENINEIINNSSYKQAALARSKIFNDRLVSPKETAMYWVEYVIRHRGAPHLRVAGIDLPWYKYYLVDVIGFIAALGVLGTLILEFLAKKIYKKLFSKAKKVSRQKSAQKTSKKVKKL